LKAILRKSPKKGGGVNRGRLREFLGFCVCLGLKRREVRYKRKKRAAGRGNLGKSQHLGADTSTRGMTRARGKEEKKEGVRNNWLTQFVSRRETNPSRGGGKELEKCCF